MYPVQQLTKVLQIGKEIGKKRLEKKKNQNTDSVKLKTIR